MNSYSTIKTIEKDIKYNKNFISKGVQKRPAPLRTLKLVGNQPVKINIAKFVLVNLVQLM